MGSEITALHIADGEGSKTLHASEAKENGLTAIGLMSGTSMDGVDAAVIRTDGEHDVRFIGAVSRASSPELKSLLMRAVEAARSMRERDGRPEPLAEAEEASTAAHAEAVHVLLQQTGLTPGDIDVIGYHGQTVLHRPEAGLTVQLGDGPALARMTGVDVVCDFRANDMLCGGEGAPMAPVYHRALAETISERPVAFLNLGGVANVTWIGPHGDPVAFDTGPANGLIDQWVEAKSGRLMDEGGALASAGEVSGDALARMLDNAYFDRKPPKSLDRFDFSLDPVRDLSEADGAATLTAFTAACIARAVPHLPAPPELWVACGGGRHNPTLMAALSAQLGSRIVAAEDLGLRADSMEAEAFAYMAVRSLGRQPLSFPGTTGVERPATGGVFYAA